MIAAVIFRPGLPFGIRLDKKTAEIGNERVNFVGLGFPPGDDIFVEWIGRRQVAESLGSGKVGGQIQANAVGTEHIGQRGDLAKIFGRKNAEIGVDVVDGDRVQADRRIGPGIIGVARAELVGQLAPLPERTAGVAALDGAVGIVPMVDHAKLELWALGDIEFVDGLAGLQQAEQMKRPVHRADFGFGSHHGDGVPGDRGRADEEAFFAKFGELVVPIQTADGVGCLRRSDDDGACLNAILVKPGFASLEELLSAVRSSSPIIRPVAVFDGNDNLPDELAIVFRNLARRCVTQPELVAIFVGKRRFGGRDSKRNMAGHSASGSCQARGHK